MENDFQSVKAAKDGYLDYYSLTNVFIANSGLVLSTVNMNPSSLSS